MSRTSRHAAVAGSRRAPVRSMLTSASVLAAATLIALGSAGTSLASWISSDNLKTPTIESGSMTLLVNGVKGIPLTNTGLQSMYPGSKVQLPVELHNSGTVESNIVATATPASNGLDVRVVSGACPGPAGNPPSTGGLSATEGPLSLGPWNANQTKTVCVEIALNPGAAQNATIPFILTFTATQAGT